MDIQERLAEVQERIAQAARNAGRDPSSVRLVAVSKTFPPERVVAAIAAGAQNIGENRVEEARDKIPAVVSALPRGSQVTWHLIGHLQRRKAREAVALFDMIQSVDSVRLAETLDRHAAAAKKRVSVLVQVNVAGDPDKFGLAPGLRDALDDSLARILALPSLRVCGLMTIGPLVPNAEEARPFFRGLRQMRDELAARFPSAEWQELSMGMTDDFTVAIEEGATIVRIGRAIFGERQL